MKRTQALKANTFFTVHFKIKIQATDVHSKMLAGTVLSYKHYSIYIRLENVNHYFQINVLTCTYQNIVNYWLISRVSEAYSEIRLIFLNCITGIIKKYYRLCNTGTGMFNKKPNHLKQIQTPPGLWRPDLAVRVKSGVRVKSQL